ncbi:MAG: hypothetical protein JWR52_2917 [Marmoricola sp.]|nr:hypothetical protein [Marmoricola sp.]
MQREPALACCRGAPLDRAPIDWAPDVRAATAAANRVLQQGFISLAANGRVSGFDGVNQWSGHYSKVGHLTLTARGSVASS